MWVALGDTLLSTPCSTPFVAVLIGEIIGDPEDMFQRLGEDHHVMLDHGLLLSEARLLGDTDQGKESIWKLVH